MPQLKVGDGQGQLKPTSGGPYALGFFKKKDHLEAE